MKTAKKNESGFQLNPYFRQALTYIVPIGLSFFLIAGLIAGIGSNPLEGLRTLLLTSFNSSFSFWETMNKFIPLLLATYAFAIPFKLKIYNIGALGQMQIGGIVAVIVSFELAFLPGFLLIPITLVCVMIASGIYAGVCGVLKNKYGINPIISTVMLNFVSSYLVLFFTTASGYEDPVSGHPMTLPIPKHAVFPVIGSIPSAFILILIIIIALYYILKRTILGYKIEATGFNQIASRIYGVNVPRLIVLTLFFGGAMAGLAGALQVMGVQKRLIEGFAATSGAEFGTFGILTALISEGEAVGAPIASFFMAVLLVGADAMQRTLQVPVEIVFLMQSVMVVIIVVIRQRMNPRK